MTKKNQQLVREAPAHIEHLESPPHIRNSKEMTFDSLDDFERYIMDESWDNEYDRVNIHVKYLPPFIMSQIHGNEENIKAPMNSLNKKFRRQLQHHIQRHLLPDIKKMAGIEYDFHKEGEETVPNFYGTASVHRWHYKDETNHGFDESEYRNRNHWRVEVDVESNSSDPFVTIDFKAIPDGEQI